MSIGAGLYMYDVVKKGSRSLSHLLISSCRSDYHVCTQDLVRSCMFNGVFDRCLAMRGICHYTLLTWTTGSVQHKTISNGKSQLDNHFSCSLAWYILQHWYVGCVTEIWLGISNAAADVCRNRRWCSRLWIQSSTFTCNWISEWPCWPSYSQQVSNLYLLAAKF